MRKLSVVVPKGSLYQSVVRLLGEAGLGLEVSERTYRPEVSDPAVDVKIMRPQNIPELIQLGSHDAGFTGHDWVVETGARIKEVLDLKFDPVRIVAAIPDSLTLKDLQSRTIVVASEYENISRDFLVREGYKYVYLRTYGATEVFPPDDADMIIDNTATGRTLREHRLKIIATLLESSTCFVASLDALKDEWKAEKVAQLAMLFQAIIDARTRVMLEMNVPKDRLDAIVKGLPCMRSPTIAQLYGEQGYAVKVAVPRVEAARLIPQLKQLGAADILEYEFRKVII